MKLITIITTIFFTFNILAMTEYNKNEIYIKDNKAYHKKTNEVVNGRVIDNNDDNIVYLYEEGILMCENDFIKEHKKNITTCYYKDTGNISAITETDEDFFDENSKTIHTEYFNNKYKSIISRVVEQGFFPKTILEAEFYYTDDYNSLFPSNTFLKEHRIYNYDNKIRVDKYYDKSGVFTHQKVYKISIPMKSYEFDLLFTTITRDKAINIAKNAIKKYKYFKDKGQKVELINDELDYQYKVSFPWSLGRGEEFEYIHVFIGAKTGKVLKIKEDSN